MQKFKAPPLSKRESEDQIVQALNEAIETGSPFALGLYCRKIWATAEQAKMIGTDVWEVENHPKATVSSLIAEGSLKPHREVPAEMKGFFTGLFNQCE